MKKLTSVTFSSLFFELSSILHKHLVYACRSCPKRVTGIRFNIGLIGLSRGYP